MLWQPPRELWGFGLLNRLPEGATDGAGPHLIRSKVTNWMVEADQGEPHLLQGFLREAAPMEAAHAGRAVHLPRGVPRGCRALCRALQTPKLSNTVKHNHMGKRNHMGRERRGGRNVCDAKIG